MILVRESGYVGERVPNKERERERESVPMVFPWRQRMLNGRKFRDKVKRKGESSKPYIGHPLAKGIKKRVNGKGNVKCTTRTPPTLLSSLLLM